MNTDFYLQLNQRLEEVAARMKEEDARMKEVAVRIKEVAARMKEEDARIKEVATEINVLEKLLTPSFVKMLEDMATNGKYKKYLL